MSATEGRCSFSAPFRNVRSSFHWSSLSSALLQPRIIDDQRSAVHASRASSSAASSRPHAKLRIVASATV